MKNLSLILISLIVLASCQSSTYYGAQQTNHKRFDGWDREDAEFLMKTHDQVLLANALSETAEANADLRESYVLAKDVQDLVDELLLKFKLESAVQRVKLASSLSDASDEYIQKLSAISSENYDLIYHQYLSKALTELRMLSENYRKEGHSERLKAFARELKSETEEIKERSEKNDLL